MTVAYTFASRTSSIPLSELDANFATTTTLGNVSFQLGNVVTTVGNLTLTNVTISSGTATLGNVTLGNVSYSGLLTGGTANLVTSATNTRVLRLTATAGYVSNLSLTRTGYAEWLLGSTNNSAELNLSLNDETHSAPVMMFNSAKNVSVGPTSPSVKFHVTDGSLADAFRVNSLVPGSPVNNDTQQFASFQATAATSGLTFSGVDPRLLSLTVTTNNEIAFRANKPMLLGTSYVALGVTTEAMRIDSSNNVGIGTNVPGFKLDVASSSNDVGRFYNNVAGGFGQLIVGSNDRSFFIGQRSSTNVNGDLSYLYNATATPIAFFTNTTERARFSAAGDFIPTLQTSAPALSANNQMVFTLTSNTNLRISVRGSDGVTRTANITLA